MSTKLDLQGHRWTYLGLIDDKVSEYPWADHLSPAYLDGVLRRSALFEEPILVSDGYLLHSDWARNVLLDPESLLRRLIARQHVVVFSRDKEGRLDLMVENMRRSVPSYEALHNRPDWDQRQNGKRPIRELLEELCTSRGYTYATWPDMKGFDNRRGFDAIIDVLAGREFADMGLPSLSGVDFSKIVEQYRHIRKEEQEAEYRDSGKPSRGARTVWEEVVKGFADGDQNRLTELMWLGNEAYHYNMALAIAGTTQTPVNVSTFVSNRMCSEFATEAIPVDASCCLRETLSSMAPADFVTLIDELSQPRLRFRSALVEHHQSPDEERFKSEFERYAHAIGQMCPFNEHAVNAPAALGGTALSVYGTVIESTRYMLTGGVAGIAALLTSGMLPHLVAGWHRRRVSRQVKQSASRQFKPNALLRTGTFELNLKKAKEHLENSRYVV